MEELLNKVFELKLPMCERSHMDGLIKLAENVPEGCFVEAGVARGGTAIPLTQVADKTVRKIYLCDTFDGFPAPEEIDAGTNIKEGEGRGYLTEELVKSNFEKCGVNYWL